MAAYTSPYAYPLCLNLALSLPLQEGGSRRIFGTNPFGYAFILTLILTLALALTLILTNPFGHEASS